MCSRADKPSYPPPLPVKQRRSTYSGGSSMGSSMEMEPEGEKYSPLGSLHETETPLYSDVFSDCHAPQCPIHHSTGHQDRFYSESPAPPVPKKRLARAVSLPVGCVHPQCSLPSKLQNYDNPLYMLTPIRDSQLDAAGESQKPALESLSPRQPLRLLTFETPDQHLPSFFKSFQDQEQVSLDIQECHLLFLKHIAQQLETLSLGGVESISGIESIQPQEFQLCEDYQSKKIGDAVFYAVYCPNFPGQVFSAKVYRPSRGGAVSALSTPLPPHVNIQQLFVHFPQCTELQSTNSTAEPQQCAWLFLQSPDGGSTEPHRQQHMVASLLSEGYEVDIERELPQGTLEDFVHDGISLRRSQPQLYERQLSLLFLQLAQGLLHLRSHGTTCEDLQLSDVILAWSETKKRRRAEGGVEGAGERGASGRDTAERETAERGPCGIRTAKAETGEGESLCTPIQKMWKRWGPPQAVITTFRPRSERDASIDSEAAWFGRLLLHCLHLTETPVTPDLQGTPFRHGLLKLALLLQDPESGVRTPEAAGILQVLLWGPRAELIQQDQPGAWAPLLASWLSVKRSLLVQKLSELALSEGDGRPDHEDRLCLQYLTGVEPDAVLKMVDLLGLPHTVH